MTPETLTELERHFAKFPILMGGPVPDREINDAEQRLGLQIPDDYREFIRLYGGGIVGAFPILGLRQADPMGDSSWSMVEVTEHYWRERWLGVEGRLVCSEDLSGNPIFFGADGAVFVSDHDYGSVEIRGRNFEDFLRRRCLRV